MRLNQSSGVERAEKRCNVGKRHSRGNAYEQTTFWRRETALADPVGAERQAIAYVG